MQKAPKAVMGRGIGEGRISNFHCLTTETA